MKKDVIRPEGAKKFGVNVKVNKDLDKMAEKDLFPRKTEQINKIIAKLNVSR